MQAIATSHTPLMKAVVHRAYGDPQLLTVGEVPEPVPGDDDVLIRVVAASVSIGDGSFNADPHAQTHAPCSAQALVS